MQLLQEHAERKSSIVPKVTGVEVKTFGQREFRALWINRINAGCRINGISYSVFMGELHKNNIELNRKVLADLAMNNPEAFSAVVKMVKK